MVAKGACFIGRRWPKDAGAHAVDEMEKDEAVFHAIQWSVRETSIPFNGQCAHEGLLCRGWVPRSWGAQSEPLEETWNFALKQTRWGTAGNWCATGLQGRESLGPARGPGPGAGAVPWGRGPGPSAGTGSQLRARAGARGPGPSPGL